ncbi:unnamed protein product [Somion occarium]|uniref:Gfd2/YDR514C-like C-terminal domain-containing protein n=1 Tax=Somion occarium TaxID=3059160 RepID=A0ABP1CG68_9APHY
MSDFNLVDPRGWEYDLQSVYTAYLGHFQLHGIPWYERSWGVFFESFEEFLTFSWPVITITDCWTGKAHIVTRMTSIGAFLKMIKTRFGDTLTMVDNILRVQPFETSQRHMRTISDYASYKKLHSTLPAAVLAALKARVRSGEPKAIREIWDSKDKTFLAVSFESSERNPSTCLEWGFAAARCSYLDAVGVWPPDPEANYRRGHYIVTEYADKVHNKHRPNFPWAYSFGDSQQIPKSKLSQVIQAVISGMISPDSETLPNSLVILIHEATGDLRRLEEMKIKLPHNVLILDTAAYERKLFASGQRGPMKDPNGNPHTQESVLSLTNMLQSQGVDVQCIMQNAGNHAFMCLLGFQLLIDQENTKIPIIRGGNAIPAMMRSGSRSSGGILTPTIAFSPSLPIPMMTPYGIMPASSPMIFPGLSPDLFMDRDSNSSSRRGSGNFPNIPTGDYTRRASTLSPIAQFPSRKDSDGDQDVTARINGLRIASA